MITSEVHVISLLHVPRCNSDFTCTAMCICEARVGGPPVASPDGGFTKLLHNLVSNCFIGVGVRPTHSQPGHIQPLLDQSILELLRVRHNHLQAHGLLHNLHNTSESVLGFLGPYRRAAVMLRERAISTCSK